MAMAECDVGVADKVRISAEAILPRMLGMRNEPLPMQGCLEGSIHRVSNLFYCANNESDEPILH